MPVKTALFYQRRKYYSYNDDWLDAFRRHPELAVDVFNLRWPSWLRLFATIRDYELVVLLHSADVGLRNFPSLLRRILERARAKKVFFAHNEFKGLGAKVDFVRSLGVDYIASQLPLDCAAPLYEDSLEATVLSVPHALNADVFTPGPERGRPIDLGARTADYPFYLGDRDRVDICRHFLEMSYDGPLRRDISLDASERFDRDGWKRFLQSCRGTVATEAGAAVVDKDDRTRLAVQRYLDEHPSAAFEEVHQRFFAERPGAGGVSGKCVSSRHFDAIGTKTCQIMFRGRFNDTLRADEHYLALERDFSNAEDVVARLMDDDVRLPMVNQAYEYARDGHTHRHRITHLLRQIGG